MYRAEFRGEINPEDPDACESPGRHVGSSVADVKVWVEQMAKTLGYDRVVWDEPP